MLPLDLSLSGTVLLSISSTLTEDYPFYRSLRETLPVTWIRANLDSLASIRKRIRPAQRVIVAVHDSKVASYKGLIEQLAADKPVVLVCFNSLKVLGGLNQAVKKSSSVVLAHSGEPEIQRYVADVLIGNRKLMVGCLSLWAFIRQVQELHLIRIVLRNILLKS